LTKLASPADFQQRYLQDSTLDSKMFRKGLPPYARWEDRVTIVKKGMKVDLHPVLRATFKGRRIITCASQFGEPTRAGQESFTRWRDSRIKLSFSKEYVTSPPVRTFLGNNGIGYVGMGNQGCTIADILRIQSGDYAMDVDSLWRFRRSCVQREWGRMHGRELEEMIDCCDKVPRNGSRAVNSFLWRGEMTLESAQDDTVQLCDIERPFFIPSYMNVSRSPLFKMPSGCSLRRLRIQAWSRYG